MRWGIDTLLASLTLLLSFTSAFCAELPEMSWKEFQDLQQAQSNFVPVPELPKTPEDLQKFADETIAYMNTAYERIATRPMSSCSFDNTIEALDAIDRRVGDDMGLLLLVGYLNQRTPLYDASNAAFKKLVDVYYEMLKNNALRQRVRAFTGMKGLPKRKQKLYQKVIVEFDRVGNIREMIKNSELAGLWQALFERQTAFEKNILTAMDKLPFTAKQLEGLAPEILAGLQRAGEKYLISPTSYNETNAIFTQVHSKETRHHVWKAVQKKGLPENLRVFQEILALRRRIAKRLEHTSWASYALQDTSFTHGSLTRELKRTLDQTEALFRDELAKLGNQNLEYPDALYLVHQRLAKESLPNLNEYFEFEHTLEGILNRFQEFLHVKILRVQRAPSWDPSVQFFAVLDANEDTLLGGFAIDPFPRQNKDEWYWAFPINTPGENLAREKSRHMRRAFAVLNANFPKASADTPALMTFEDVSTLAHELGHIFHFILRRPTYANYESHSELQELIEVPSVFFERVFEHPKVMAQLSRHYQTGEHLSVELLTRRHQAAHAIRLFHIRSRVLGALLDLQTHGARPVSLTNLEREAFQRHYFDLSPEGSFFSSFSYSGSGGYDAYYWTYMWAEALAHQFVERAVLSDGSLNSEFGHHFRTQLLEKDSEFSAEDVLRSTLGEKPGLCSLLVAAASSGAIPAIDTKLADAPQTP